MIIKEKRDQIFLLFICDQWKSTASMRLYSVCTSPTKLKKSVIRAIGNSDMAYGDNLMAPGCEMIKLFEEDWKYRCLSDINDRLTGGFLDQCYDGEICYG